MKENVSGCFFSEHSVDCRSLFYNFALKSKRLPEPLDFSDLT